jgi:hypothetical protein
MAFLDPQLMGIFRRYMFHPPTMYRVYGILRSYNFASLRTPAGAYGLVDRLSGTLGYPVTPEQRENAAQWLMCCGVDPQNRTHRWRMWGLIHNGL